MSSPDTIVIDKDGDLRLDIVSDGGEKHGSLIVSSKALSLASPVFRRMLFGGFAESKPAYGEWNVALHDDDVHCLSIVLDIIHLNFDRVPEHLEACCGPVTSDQDTGDLSGRRDAPAHIYGIVRIVDKYDMVHIIRPWAQTWLNDVNKMPGWCAEIIWAAWVLGDESLLREQLVRVLSSAYVGPRQKHRRPYILYCPGAERNMECYCKQGQSSPALDGDEDGLGMDGDEDGLRITSNYLDTSLYKPEGAVNEIFSILDIAGMSLAMWTSLTYITTTNPSTFTERIDGMRLGLVAAFIQELKELCDSLLINIHRGLMTSPMPHLQRCRRWMLFTGGIMEFQLKTIMPESQPDRQSLAQLHAGLDFLEGCGRPIFCIEQFHRSAMAEVRQRVTADLERCSKGLVSEAQVAHLRRQREKSGVRL